MHSLHKICHCRNTQWNRNEFDTSDFFHRSFFEKEISTKKITVNFTASQTHFSENGISPINFLLHFKSSFSLYLIFIVLHNFQLYHQVSLPITKRKRFFFFQVLSVSESFYSDHNLQNITFLKSQSPILSKIVILASDNCIFIFNNI